MIEQEAIKSLKNIVEYWTYKPTEVEAAKMAIEALEKQIPRKVVNNGYGVYFCPTCKSSIWQIRTESKFCFRCGQKLNWD